MSGQIAETIGPRPGQDPLQHYLRVVKEKTASLVATAGRFGAMFSAAPADVVARIEPACEAIGVAWQLSDDILDVASDSDAVRQDARHRPARGRAQPARAARAAAPAARATPGSASCWSRLT